MNRILATLPRSPSTPRKGLYTLSKPAHPLFLLPLLATAAFSQVPARSLDAGTWVRQSLSVVPVQVGECPSEEIFVRRAFRRLNAELLLPMRVVAHAQAHEEEAYCEEARDFLVRRLGGDWSGLTAMQRFDRNDLPSERLEAVRMAVATTPWQTLPPVLARELADTLRGVLATKALERSQHLVSDEQQNSSISVKMKTEDVTDTELSLLRGSAHVLALRVGALDVGRSKKDGLSFRADFSAAIWSFDPQTRSFTQEGAWSASGGEGGSPQYAGAQVGSVGRGLGQRILDLRAFHFTTQILAGNVGNWINPASTFSTNTGADLHLNRRFRYFENRVDASGNTVPVQAGYGYLDNHFPKDSTWRLRHIGGIQPYSGLVLEEVPGDAWGFVSLAQVASRIDGRNDTTRNGLSVNLRAASPLWELRFGTRSPLGSSHSFLSLELPFYLGDVHGSLGTSPSDFGAQETGTLFGWGIEPGWETRWNIRRTFFSAGAQVGLRMNTVFLSPSNDPVQDTMKINWLRNFEGVVTVHGGVSWSLTPWSGIGVEVAYDWLDGRSDWDRGSGDNYYNADWTPVPGPTTGQGRLRWLFQYVWK